MMPETWWKWTKVFSVVVLTLFVDRPVRGESSTSVLPQMQPVDIGQPVCIEVQPARIDLRRQRSRVHVLATAYYADGHLQDVTRVARVTSSAPDIARVVSNDNSAAYVEPVHDGETEIVVTVGDIPNTVPVTVSCPEELDPVSFRLETLAALTRQGCNSGGCHGTPSGKGGFRLSLEAYDPALDELTLIHEFYGRRTNPLQPDQSLLLRKPTLDVAHGGGRRIRRDDVSYQVLRDWIREGCQVDPPSAPTCVRLEVLPGPQRLLVWPAHTQQLIGIAHFSDGTHRDVTDLVKWMSSDTGVAQVNPQGVVIGSGRGNVAVMARYLEQLETVQLTFVQPVEGFVWNNPPEHNYVDTWVYRKLKQMQYLPSELCDDSEFLRRVSLDVIGLPPSIDEAKNFLADSASDKRSRKIEELLERPEYAAFWAQKWADLLRVREKNLSSEGVHKFHTWLVEAFRQNMPLHTLAESLLTSQGSTFLQPPANYYRTLSDPTVSVEATAQLFLGVRMQCAKCHNHPFEKWTQDNYYGLSAFFSRVKQSPGSRAGESVIWVSRQGDMVQPRTGKVMQPWLPVRGTLDGETPRDPRVHLVEWLTADDNPYFAKVGANRIWAHVMGRGIVEPVDDFRESNPPANQELLDALADEFRDSGYNQKQILRTILNSRVYQHSAVANAMNRTDEKYFSHALVRMWDAEQLLDAIGYLTGVWESFAGLPAETRATQLPSPDATSEFLKIFGQPDRETSCACERTHDSSLTQALQMLSGGLVHGKLCHSENRFRQAIAQGRRDEEILADLYLAAYARRPSAVEQQATLGHLQRYSSDRQAGWEDICWSLINSKEFLFRH